MLDLILSFVVALVVAFVLLKCGTPVWATIILVFALGVCLAYAALQIVGLNQTAYSARLNLLVQQNNGNVLTAIQLSNKFGPFLVFIVIGFNLIATSIGFLLAYGLARVSGKGSRKH